MDKVDTQQQESTSKAGRHRLYSNEQRKDRNRQAQDAFQDRRSKYTKTLEEAMLKFEDTIENLKECNEASEKRADRAEEHCKQLGTEVTSLQKLLQMALAENQRFLQMLPVSPPSSTREVVNHCSPVTTASSSTPDFMFSSLDDPQRQFHSPEQEFFDTHWLTVNQKRTGHSDSFIFTDNQGNEFCLFEEETGLDFLVDGNHNM